jgi:hypothetical protein
MSSVSPLVALAVVFGGIVLAAVVHELGHLLACLLGKVEVCEFQLGAPPLAFRFRVGKTRVILGLPFRGHVRHGPTTTGRRAAFLAAGPLADVAAAGVVLTLPMGRQSATCLAVVFGGIGIASLVPCRTKKGGMSDGAGLLGLRGYGRNAVVQADMREFAAAPDGPGLSERASRVLAADREGVPIAREWAGLLAEMLRREGRMAEVLEIHAGLPVLDGALDETQAWSAHLVEWNVVAVPGLPAEVVHEAASRVQWVLDHYHFGPDDTAINRYAVLHTLATARLRQGRLAEVEPLCTEVLASDPDPGMRATTLATVVLARRALGEPYEELLAGAVALSPDADLVEEAGREAAPRAAG